MTQEDDGIRRMEARYGSGAISELKSDRGELCACGGGGTRGDVDRAAAGWGSTCESPEEDVGNLEFADEDTWDSEVEASKIDCGSISDDSDRGTIGICPREDARHKGASQSRNYGNGGF